jgi:hypothetical protein
VRLSRPRRVSDTARPSPAGRRDRRVHDAASRHVEQDLLVGEPVAHRLVLRDADRLGGDGRAEELLERAASCNSDADCAEQGVCRGRVQVIDDVPSGTSPGLGVSGSTRAAARGRRVAPHRMELPLQRVPLDVEGAGGPRDVAAVHAHRGRDRVALGGCTSATTTPSTTATARPA